MQKENIMGFFQPSVGASNQVAEYQSNIKFFDEIENFLLGSFDKDGKYAISEEIKNELVSLKKIYQYAYSETIFCESEFAFEKLKNLQFLVKIVEDEQKNMVANLCLIQEISRANGLYKSTAVTPIAEYIAPNSPSFVNDCFEKFNIFSQTDGGLQKKEIAEKDPILILMREKMLLQKRETLNEEDKIFGLLIEKKLELLSKHKLGKKLIEEFNKKVENAKGVGIIKDMKGYNRHLNSILDKIVEENKSMLLDDPVLISKWGKLNSEATTQIAKNVELAKLQTSEVVDLDIPKKQNEQNQGKKSTEQKQVKNQEKSISQTPKIESKKEGPIKISSQKPPTKVTQSTNVEKKPAQKEKDETQSANIETLFKVAKEEQEKQLEKIEKMPDEIAKNNNNQNEENLIEANKNVEKKKNENAEKDALAL